MSVFFFIGNIRKILLNIYTGNSLVHSLKIYWVPDYGTAFILGRKQLSNIK